MGHRIESKNGRISLVAVLGLTLLNACTSAVAKPPTCTQPVGKWKNQQQSVLAIKHFDPATGALSGEYISHSGASAGSAPYPVVGWLNSAPAQSSASGKGDHAQVITFAVRWGELGSVSAWTGTCAVNSQSSGLEQISALWHTTRSNTGYEWDHTLTGADRFDPIE